MTLSLVQRWLSRVSKISSDHHGGWPSSSETGNPVGGKPWSPLPLSAFLASMRYAVCGKSGVRTGFGTSLENVSTRALVPPTPTSVSRALDVTPMPVLSHGKPGADGFRNDRYFMAFVFQVCGCSVQPGTGLLSPDLRQQTKLVENTQFSPCGELCALNVPVS